MQVTELGYIGIGADNLDAWRRFCCDIVGMEPRDDGRPGKIHFRMDSWHHRLTVHAEAENDLLYLGWRVANAEDMAAIADRLRTNGVACRIGTAEESAERRVLGLLKLTDPSGCPIEIFYGPAMDKRKPFHPGRPMHGRFRTGETGLGHCLLSQSDLSAALQFYKLLGLKGGVEYCAKDISAPSDVVFMHCNARQHSIAFVQGKGRRINHLMVEYEHLDDLGIAFDLMQADGGRVLQGLGKHANDEALTFYVKGPSGWGVELGWGGRPASAQQEYYVRDMYGHRSD